MRSFSKIDLPGRLSPVLPIWAGEAVTALICLAATGVTRVVMDMVIPGVAPFFFIINTSDKRIVPGVLFICHNRRGGSRVINDITKNIKADMKRVISQLIIENRLKFITQGRFYRKQRSIL